MGPPNPMGFFPVQDEVMSFLRDTEGLDPQVRQAERQRYFDKKFQNRFYVLDPGDQRQVLQAFGVPPPATAGTLKAGEFPTMAERLFGGFQNPITTNPLTHAVNAISALTLPGRVAGEAIDTVGDLATGRAQRPQPTAIGPGSIIPQTAGGLVEQAVNARYALPIGKLLGSPLKLISAYKRLAENIRYNQEMAALENKAWESGLSRPGMKALPSGGGPPKQLPSFGGTGGPYPMSPPPSPLSGPFQQAPPSPTVNPIIERLRQGLMQGMGEQAAPRAPGLSNGLKVVPGPNGGVFIGGD